MPTLTTSIEKTAAAIGSSENCGESSTHTAHDHDMTVFFIEVKPASKLIADASAELNCSTFTTGRSTGKVSQDRRTKISGAERKGTSS